MREPKPWETLDLGIVQQWDNEMGLQWSMLARRSLRKAQVQAKALVEGKPEVPRLPEAKGKIAGAIRKHDASRLPEGLDVADQIAQANGLTEAETAALCAYARYRCEVEPDPRRKTKPGRGRYRLTRTEDLARGISVAQIMVVIREVERDLEHRGVKFNKKTLLAGAAAKLWPGECKSASSQANGNQAA